MSVPPTEQAKTVKAIAAAKALLAGQSANAAAPPTSTLPTLTVRDADGAAAAYLDFVGEVVFSSMNRWAVRDDGTQCAQLFIQALKAALQPRDPLEEMLVLQMAFTHARIAKLSYTAIQQDRTKNVQVVNDACDQAANTFRRLMLTLNEYRNPGRPKIFAPIRQANLAQVQQVQNAGNTNFEKKDVTNELGCTTPVPASLPPLAAGLGVPPRRRRADPPVAAQHGAADAGRQGSIAHERLAARRAQRKTRGRTARSQRDVPPSEVT